MDVSKAMEICSSVGLLCISLLIAAVETTPEPLDFERSSPVIGHDPSDGRLSVASRDLKFSRYAEGRHSKPRVTDLYADGAFRARVRNDMRDTQRLVDRRASLRSGCKFAIDVVYTWVDSTNQTWKQTESSYAHSPTSDSTLDSKSASRFLDHDELRYSLRSVLKFMPWVRHIWVVVSAGQRPRWLSNNHPDITFVDHETIFPKRMHKYLPTFNSFAIEAYLHRIPRLASQFIYFNDDMFIGAPVFCNDFFTAAGVPKVSFQLSFHAHAGSDHLPRTADAYTFANRNDNRLLDDAFGAERRYNILHQAYPLTKALYKRVWRFWGQDLNRLAHHRFRTRDDVIPHYLALWLGIYKGGALRLQPRQFPSHKFINLYTSMEVEKTTLTNLLVTKPKFFCINDRETSPRNADAINQWLERDFYRIYFPRIPPWEQNSEQG